MGFQDQNSFAPFFTLSQEAMLILDTDGYIRQANPAFFQMTELPEEMVLGQRLADLLHPEELPLVTEWWQHQPRNTDIEIRIQHHRGDWRLLRGRAYFAESENLIYVSACDITSNRATEQQLSEAYAKSQALLSSIPDLIFTFDRGGTCLDVHAPDPGQLNMPVEAFLGKDVFAIWPKQAATFHMDWGRKALDTGHIQTYEYELLTQQGAELIFEARAVPLPPEKMVFIVRDITEKRSAEQALRDSEAHMRALLRNFPNGAISVFDRSYRFLLAAGLGFHNVGIVPKHLVGRLLRETFPADQVDAAMPHYEQVFRTGQPTAFELELTESAHMITVAPVRWQDDQVMSIVAVARDITDDKKQATALQALNSTLERQVAKRTKALSETNQRLQIVNEELAGFSYTVSHDLRAPLRAIMGFGSILKEEHAQELSEDGRQLLDVVIRNGVRMGKLIDDILAYSRLSRRDRRSRKIDLEKMSREVYAELHQLDPDQKRQFHIHPISHIMGDPDMIRQVLQNLLSNAIKYSSHEAEPRIEIGQRHMEDELVFYVADNGVGFNQTYAHKIFGVFQRLHKASEFEGTGVGMAIAHRIVTQHGGRIWAKGKVGEGATFFFTLPLAAESGEEME